MDGAGKETQELVRLGIEVAGNTGGDVLRLFTNEPDEMKTGPIIVRGLEVATDFALQSLSHRERIRAGAGLVFAFTNIQNRLARGEKPRDDGFFERGNTGRSTSEEVLEGALHKAKSEHEEKKLKLIGNIFANVSFMPEVSPFNAYWILQMVSGLTYRQLCILALIQRKDQRGVSWGPNDGDPAFQMEYESLENMFSRAYGLRTSISPAAERGEKPRIAGLSRIGKLCYDVMGLGDIPEEDLRLLEPHFPQAFQGSG